MSRKVEISKINLLFDRAGAWCAENPMKVYAGIYLLGDLIMGTNPNGHWLWAGAAALSMFANGNKILFGKGGEAVEADSFRVTKDSFVRTVKDTVLSPMKFFAPSNLREIAQTLKDVKSKKLVTKAKRSLAFWRYPLDAGWMMYAAVGTSYMVDALALGSPRYGDACIGFWGATASAYGFATDNNKVVGQMFGCLTLFLLAKGAATGNWSQIGAPLVYLYGNLAMGQAITKRQSNHTIRQQEPSPT